MEKEVKKENKLINRDNEKIKVSKRKNEPLFQRMIKEIKRIRWTKKDESKKLFISVLIGLILMATFFIVIDQIIKAILGTK